MMAAPLQKLPPPFASSAYGVGHYDQKSQQIPPNGAPLNHPPGGPMLAQSLEKDGKRYSYVLRPFSLGSVPIGGALANV